MLQQRLLDIQALHHSLNHEVTTRQIRQLQRWSQPRSTGLMRGSVHTALVQQTIPLLPDRLTSLAHHIGPSVMESNLATGLSDNLRNSTPHGTSADNSNSGKNSIHSVNYHAASQIRALRPAEPPTMKQSLRLLHVMTGGIILLSAANAAAITLGALQGTAILGQPLRLVVQATLDNSESLDPKCLGANFAYGDTPVSALRVRAVLDDEPGTAGPRAMRVEADMPVNEPIVTVTVYNACPPRVQRQYTLFAEPGEAELTPPSWTKAADKGVPPPTAWASNTPPPPAASSTAPEPSRASSTPRSTLSAPASSASSARRAAANLKPNPPAAKARLKLDLLDELEPSAAVLKPSWSLSAWQEAPNPKRDEAARWWRTLSTDPSQHLEQNLQLKQVEEQVRLLKRAAEKGQQQQQLLHEQLQSAEDARYANPLVYALAVFGCLSASAAIWAGLRLRRRQREARPWWQAADPEMSDNLPLAEAPNDTVSATAPAPTGRWLQRLRHGISSKSVKRPSADQGFGKDDKGDPHLTNAAEADSDLTPLGFSKGILSTYVETPRTVKTEELFDIQQQADFFVSLGQHEQAIELLIHHIRDNEETSPMAYLDLLKIYHSLGQQREYDQIRESFNRIFTASVPDMDAFNQPTYGLEAYPSALNRIEALWPSPKVLDVIEESIFRKPGHNPRHAFTLEAYRELLLLHAMVKGYIEPPSVVLAESRRSSWQDQQEKVSKSEFGDTQVNPLSTTEFINSVQPDIQEALSNGLDIDLGAFEPAPSIDDPEKPPTGPALKARDEITADLDLLLDEPTDTAAPHPIFSEPVAALALNAQAPSVEPLPDEGDLDHWFSAEATRDAQAMASLDFDLSQFDQTEQTLRIVKK